MKKMMRKINPLLVLAVMVWFILPVRVTAVSKMAGICQVQADEGKVYTVKSLDYSYDHNTYLSLRDMAVVFQDTDKSFALEITKNAISLNSESTYISVGEENAVWGDEEIPDVSLRRNNFEVDGQERVYYTMIAEISSGYYDCFMTAADLAMILDVDIFAPAAGLLQIHTQDPFGISPTVLEEEGYFYGVNSVLVGDATTGEIYYRYQSDAPYAIASTTKLMTYLLAMDAISAGQITLEEQVTISEAAQRLAESSDGVIPLKAGEQITVQELLVGILLPSSNECALCLAETIAGSEEAFVEKMNQKARELGLSQAIFFNSHGLPSYTESSIPSKRQNRMSAEDMFRLSSYLLNIYPQITEITSLEKVTLESLDFEVRNTNPLLYNLSDVTGLKTGTTNKAGACLVTSLSVDDGKMKHDLVVVVLGAEDSMERGRISGVLAGYARQAFYGSMEKEGEMAEENPANVPVNAEAAVERILWTAKHT